MNLELLESFGQNYPEEFDGHLDCVTMALTCAFNRRGSLLAVGCNDGRVIVWDFVTRGVAKNLIGHQHPVCSLSWSRGGHKVLSASTDNTACLWDVLTGECEHRYRFPSPVLRVQFNPRNENEFLVCPMRNPAVVIDVQYAKPNRPTTTSPLPKKPDRSKKSGVGGDDYYAMEVDSGGDDDDDDNDNNDNDDGDSSVDGRERDTTTSSSDDFGHDTDKEVYKKLPVTEDIDIGLTAAYDHSGQHIFVGNGRGKIFVVETPSKARLVSGTLSAEPGPVRRTQPTYSEPLEPCIPAFSGGTMRVIHWFRVTSVQSSAAAVRSIEFARRGQFFLVNTADRIIRVYETSQVMPPTASGGVDGGGPPPAPLAETPEPIQKLQDLVNKTMWKKCCFSGDGEYICAGSARSHALYIWERSIGNLVKILHGTKGEVLVDVVWHPVRPIVCSVSSGSVSIWAQNQVENWSAFAPDFKELDENVEYEERESEFDLSDEDHSVQEDERNKQDEDVEVDVVRVEPIHAFCSSDEDEGWENKELVFLPCTPDVDEPEDPRSSVGGDSPTGNASDSGRENSTPAPPPAPNKNRRKRTKVHDVRLDNASVNEVHPYLAGKKTPAIPSGKKVGKDTRKKTKERGK